MTLVLFVSLLRRFCAAPLLLLISLSDIRKRRVPDGLLLPLAALSLLRLLSAWETACEPAALLALRTLLFEVLPGGAGMVFKKGQRYSGTYQTPFGPVGMEILTNDVRGSALDEDGGKLSTDYSISLKGLHEGRNILNITLM